MSLSQNNIGYFRFFSFYLSSLLVNFAKNISLDIYAIKWQFFYTIGLMENELFHR